MLDHFIVGDTDRISPEAPVPVVHAKEEILSPGGAGNVASNIAALGGKVSLVGLLGSDTAAGQLFHEFKIRKVNTGCVIKVPGPTIQKIRVIARSQQIVRIDKEKIMTFGSRIEKKIIKFIYDNISDWDSLVISNYAKGLINKNLASKIIGLARKKNKPVVADIGSTNPKEFFYFKGVTIFAPNYKEASQIAGTDDLVKAGKYIQKRLHCDVVITQGSQGVTLFEKNKIAHFPAVAKEVFDVTGAGDTLVAVIALSLASGANLREAVYLANCAAGIAVGKLGTGGISLNELKNQLNKDRQ